MAQEFKLLFLLLFVVAFNGNNATGADVDNTTTTAEPTGNVTSTTVLPNTATITAEPNSTSATVLPNTATATAEPNGTSATVSPNTATGSGGVSTPVPATTKPPTEDPCVLNPCGLGSTCERRANQTFVCLCLTGDYYSDIRKSCESAKVFPGQLNLNRKYNDSMADNTSQVFLDTSEEITAQLFEVYSGTADYTGSIVLELKARPIENSKVWSREESRKVNASVQIIFSANSDIKSTEVVKKMENIACGGCILEGATFKETNLCHSACDDTTTRCSSEDGSFNCSCQENYVLTDYTTRICIACPSGYEASGGDCVKCPFGRSGLNCNESWKLVLVIVGSVLGGLLLITLILLPIVALKSSKKSSKKSKDADIGKPYVSHSPAKAPLVNSSLANGQAPSVNGGPANGVAGFANAGVPRIPRATTTSNWDHRANLEMTPSNSRQNLIPVGGNSRLYDDPDDMNSNLYTQARPQSSVYAQARPQNNPYAQNRPQTNPYATSQGQTNAYCTHDNGRRFN